MRRRRKLCDRVYALSAAAEGAAEGCAGCGIFLRRSKLDDSRGRVDSIFAYGVRFARVNVPHQDFETKVWPGRTLIAGPAENEPASGGKLPRRAPFLFSEGAHLLQFLW